MGMRNGSLHKKFLRAVKDCTKVGALEWIPKDRERGVDVKAKKVIDMMNSPRKRKRKKMHKGISKKRKVLKRKKKPSQKQSDIAKRKVSKKKKISKMKKKTSK